MRIYLLLIYNSFNLLDYKTWLAPFVRLATYFRNRGMNGETVKWHHCGIKVVHDNGIIEVFEALGSGIVQGGENLLEQYEKIKLVDITEAVNPCKFHFYLRSQVGRKYDYVGVMFYKLIYQIFGIWLRVRKPKKHDCSTYIAKGMYLHSKENNFLYKHWERFDAQDFVRIDSCMLNKDF